MDWEGMGESLWRGINAQLFELGGTAISVATVLTMVTIMLLTMVASRFTRQAIHRGFKLRGVDNEGTIGVVTRLVHFVFLLVGFGIAVEAAGIDLGALFAAGAVFAVALGFAVQNIVQNFVAGFILLAERVIKPGDVLEVEGQLVKVRSMGIRATVGQTLNDEDLIIPNGTLVQSAVKNFTFSSRSFRLRTVVGVVYSSDMKQVMTTLEETARATDFRDLEREPVVLMTDFGDNSVNFDVSVWINDPWQMRRLRSLLNVAIWEAFQDGGIVIAFPQLDVHFDKPVGAGLARLGAAS